MSEEKIDPVKAALARAAEKNGTPKPKVAPKPKPEPVEVKPEPAEAAQPDAPAPSDAPAKGPVDDTADSDEASAHDAWRAVHSEDDPRNHAVKGPVDPEYSTENPKIGASLGLVGDRVVFVDVVAIRQDVLASPHVPQVDGKGGYGGRGWGR